MPNFTEEQLTELETVFVLERRESLPIRDGRVNQTQMVWWRGESGPEHVKAKAHWKNISEYPDIYQHNKPQVFSKVTYVD